MVIKKFTIAILLITAMASIFSTCKKGGLGCANTVYSFKINVQAYPDRDSIHINDTIWIELNSPTSLTDLRTNKLIDFSGATNLGSAITVVKFIGGSLTDPGSVYSANSFDFVLVKSNNSCC